MSIERIVTNTEQDTSATGERLAGVLRSGDVVLLFGELGAPLGNPDDDPAPRRALAADGRVPE